MAPESAISHWFAVFAAPQIIVVGKDMGFIEKVLRGFGTSRNILLHTVIPGHRQSLGAAERRRGHFRTAIKHIIANSKENCSARKEWWEFPEMATMHLNHAPQVQQFEGFAPGGGVFARAPKLPIGAAGNPNFADFTNPKDARNDQNPPFTCDNSPN